MGWNNASETKKFLRRLEREEKEYRAAGMTDEQITEIQAFDWEQFRSDRRYRTHTQDFSFDDFSEDGTGEESQSPLYEKFMEQMTYTMKSIPISEGRYAWVDEIENEKLLVAIDMLTLEQINLLTYIVVDGLDQTQLGKKLNISQSAISQRISTIRKIFQKIFGATL